MKARRPSRFSTAQAGWIALIVFGAWLAFLLVPFGDAPKPARVPSHALLDGEEELRAAGLPYNADWIGLPAYFAAWADRLTWSGEKLGFGYWNPGARRYSYRFEVARTARGYRFRRLRDEPASDEGVEGLDEPGMLPTHPFDFGVSVPAAPRLRTGHDFSPSHPEPAVPAGTKPRVDVDLKTSPVKVPPTAPASPSTDATK